MKRNILFCLLCLIVMVGTAEARQMGDQAGGQGYGGGMHGGGMHGGGKMGGGKMGCGMQGGGKMGGGMHGGKMGGGMKGGGMKGGHGGGRHGAMGAFHHWMQRVMHHRQELNISAEQADRMAQFSAMHAQNAIRNQAEMRVLGIDFRQALRKPTVDMKAVEKILKQKADVKFRNQKDGVVFYTQVLKLLTDDQKKMIWETFGSPFPNAWEKGRHGGRHGGRQGGRHMYERHHDYDRPEKDKPAGDKDNPNKT